MHNQIENVILSCLENGIFRQSDDLVARNSFSNQRFSQHSLYKHILLKDPYRRNIAQKCNSDLIVTNYCKHVTDFHY